MIVITNPTSITNEMEIIHALFQEGLDLLHIRKPEYSDIKLALFIHQIKKEYRNKLVLHSHHQIAEVFGISHLHFSERDRNAAVHNAYTKPVRLSYTMSTSIHSIENFNMLPVAFEYAFLSPVYSSISKVNYHPKINLKEAIKKRTNYKTKLIALGGIDKGNIKKTVKAGFDDIALLGSIWNSEKPIENFKLCQQIALSY